MRSNFVGKFLTIKWVEKINMFLWRLYYCRFRHFTIFFDNRELLQFRFLHSALSLCVLRRKRGKRYKLGWASIWIFLFQNSPLKFSKWDLLFAPPESHTHPLDFQYYPSHYVGSECVDNKNCGWKNSSLSRMKTQGVLKMGKNNSLLK
jgi:hypothetical protein